eukprot:363469-Chlamydomonas_euryale.AAC.6
MADAVEAESAWKAGGTTSRGREKTRAEASLGVVLPPVHATCTWVWGSDAGSTRWSCSGWEGGVQGIECWRKTPYLGAPTSSYTWTSPDQTLESGGEFFVPKLWDFPDFLNGFYRGSSPFYQGPLGSTPLAPRSGRLTTPFNGPFNPL